MCNDCRRIDQLGRKAKVTKEEMEQRDIMLRWRGGSFSVNNLKVVSKGGEK